jgi:endonuclease G
MRQRFHQLHSILSELLILCISVSLRGNLIYRKRRGAFARLALMTKREIEIRTFLTGVTIVLMFAAFGCESRRDPTVGENEPDKASLPQSVHLFFGNPSGANQSDPDNYLIVGDGSVISYNNSRGTPNWVSWRTVKSDLGPSLKRPEFRPDPRLPAWFARISYSDYSGSGYDRGHLLPSADRFGNAALNEETFMMTNIVPQTPALNQYPWEKLESYARGQARRGFDVYQIAGVYGTRQVLKGRIAVPTHCWKIVAVLPNGKNNINERTRIIAVDMPNSDGIESAGWQGFKTTIRAIEEKTGYDLFRSLPQEFQDIIETRTEIGSP